MTIEKLKEAQEVLIQIEQTQSQIDVLENLLAKDDSEGQKARFKGLDIEISTSVLKADAKKKKVARGKQLKKLQAKFDKM